MPRYFFHLTVGDKTEHDASGIDLDSDEQAKREALNALPHLCEHVHLEGPGHQQVRLDALDAEGNRLLSVTMSVDVNNNH